MDTGPLTPANIDEYLHSRDMSVPTQRLYGVALHSCRKHVEDSGQATLQAAILSWKQSLTRQASKTIREYVKAVERFFEWCVEAGKVETNAFPKIKLPKLSHVRPRLTMLDQDIVKLMRVVKSDGSNRGLRDYAILDLMLHTGLRRMSVVLIDIDDFNRQELDDGVTVAILQYCGKGHYAKDQTVVVPEEVLSNIERYLVGGSPARSWATAGPLFRSTRSGKRISPSTLRDLVVGRLKEAQVWKPGLSCHSMRHTAASKGSALGSETRDLMEMLGHSDQRTTEGYIHSLHRILNAPERRIRYGYE